MVKRETSGDNVERRVFEGEVLGRGDVEDAIIETRVAAPRCRKLHHSGCGVNAGDAVHDGSDRFGDDTRAACKVENSTGSSGANRLRNPRQHVCGTKGGRINYSVRLPSELVNDGGLAIHSVRFLGV